MRRIDFNDVTCFLIILYMIYLFSTGNDLLSRIGGF